ncbi:uncharacterized protein [Apostichopus japonicus]|uniref:uncharacterized protein n=1 Tax=Stichopus japonicus TaxID=307972 RepID=UPI003AB5BFBA
MNEIKFSSIINCFLLGICIHSTMVESVAFFKCTKPHSYKDAGMACVGNCSDQMELIPSTDETVKQETTMGIIKPTRMHSTDKMRSFTSTFETSRTTKGTLGTQLSDRTATAAQSADGMRILPSTDEITTRSENLLSTTGMRTTGERIKQEITLSGIKSTSMPPMLSTDEMRLFTSTFETSRTTKGTLGTQLSDRTATAAQSADGMRILPSTDEMTTRSENLLSTTGMRTTGNNTEWNEVNIDAPNALYG